MYFLEKLSEKEQFYPRKPRADCILPNFTLFTLYYHFSKILQSIIEFLMQ